MVSFVSRLKRRRLVVVALAVAGAIGVWAATRGGESPAGEVAKTPGAAPRPALTVTLTQPAPAEWPQTIVANGNVAAWQEAVIGAELSGYRLTEVRVNVGDRVDKGELLARISADVVSAELAQAKAAVAEAQAALLEARANADRARQLQGSGAISAQQATQFLTAEQTAQARLEAARARVAADEVRLAQTRVLAPDAGVISARMAAVGTLAQPGQELFRLIRGGRLEWRAELTARELSRIRPGMPVAVSPEGAAGQPPVRGKVRMLAPTIDPQTRNALVYVDLPASSALRAGMFARGEFDLGKGQALTLPQSAIVQREGFSYVFRVDEEGRVAQTKVSVGRRVGERTEVMGLEPSVRVAASGAGFLNDGDLVRVVADAAAAPR